MTWLACVLSETILHVWISSYLIPWGYDTGEYTELHLPAIATCQNYTQTS